MSTEFDRMVDLMLGQEMFNLLASGAWGGGGRNQYMTCWRRWAQFSSRMGESPWTTDAMPGWGGETPYSIFRRVGVKPLVYNIVLWRKISIPLVISE